MHERIFPFKQAGKLYLDRILQKSKVLQPHPHLTNGAIIKTKKVIATLLSKEEVDREPFVEYNGEIL